MEDQDLRNLLERLHIEIEQKGQLDDQEREMLRHLGMDINDLLDKSEQAGVEVEPSLLERLEDTIETYEISYPELTMLLNKVLSILSSAGI